MENIKLDDFTKYKFLSGVKNSPDGKYVCFAVHEMDVDDNKYLSNLWLYNTENKSYSRLTGFNKESNFIWLQDSENIIFS
jgi:dipeptidyl aminopeptidase/acylaminoacyl peptidase